jgi:hypothetical protein
MDIEAIITSPTPHNEPTYIEIKNGRIGYAFHFYFKKEGNMYAGYIPAYKIHFSSPSEEQVKRRAEIMVRSFYNYMEAKNTSFKDFVLTINGLGFKAPEHNYVMGVLTGKIKPRRKTMNTTFSSTDDLIPMNFREAGQKIERMSVVEEMAY